VNGPPGIAAGLIGSIRAVGWALRFYSEHGWPLVGLAALPAVVRLGLELRLRHQMLPASAGEGVEAIVAVWRGLLLLAIAGLDLLPDAPWWESIWPGAWMAQLGGRVGHMSGRGIEWIGLCLWIATIVIVMTFVLRSVTAPHRLASALALTGMRPLSARRRAEAITFAVANLVTVPVTTLLMYAAVARAALCLRI
jgi:hypothetical protein